MGLEPTTATLATWRSTTELHPRWEEKDFLHITNYKAAFLDCKGEFTSVSARIRRPRRLLSTPGHLE